MKRYSPSNRIFGSLGWPLVSGLLMGMLACTQGHAADAAANQLQAIDVQTLPGQTLQLTLRMTGPAPQPLSFTIDNPARISLDLPNTAVALPSRRIDVHSAGVQTILAAESKERSRLVLTLDKLVPYETRGNGNDIIVIVGATVQPGASGGAVVAQASAPA